MITTDPMPTFVYPITDKMRYPIDGVIANDEFILCLHHSYPILVYVLHKASNTWLDDVTFSRRYEGSGKEWWDPQREGTTLKLVGFTGPRTFVMLRHRVTMQHPPNWFTAESTAYTCQLSERSNIIHVVQSTTVLELEDRQYPDVQTVEIQTACHHHGADGSFYMMLFWDRATHLYKVHTEHLKAEEVVRIDNEFYEHVSALSEEKVLMIGLVQDGFYGFHLRTYDPSLAGVSERSYVPPMPTNEYRHMLIFEDNFIVFYEKRVDVINLRSPDVHTPILKLERRMPPANDSLSKLFALSSGEIILTAYRYLGSESWYDRYAIEVYAWKILAPPRLAELALCATHRHMSSAIAQKLHPSRVRNVPLLIDFLLNPPITSADV